VRCSVRGTDEATLKFKPILVVDDHDDSRELIATFLSQEGYPVLQAANGKEALDLLLADGQEAPCLVVLDLDMPVMSGLEFLALARSLERISTIPVVVTSGSRDHLETLRLEGVVASVPKPVNLATLLSITKEASVGATPPPGQRTQGT
jgi:CheY-like chemotaxis protein